MSKHNNKILIVEDDAGIRKFLKASLSGNNYDIIETNSGEKALGIISSHCPDLILLDLGLPDMDGNDIIQNVRKWTKTPIVVISARTTELDKAQALNLCLAVTGGCLLMMFLSRKIMYPWIISQFSLILPVFLVFSNMLTF